MMPKTDSSLGKRGLYHPGRKAGGSSNVGKNVNPHAATILFMGVTGAGKSATINSLLNTQVADVGNQNSVSKEFVEYRVKVPVNDSQNSSATLTLIDTPGLGGVKASQKPDGIVLTAVQSYLDRAHRHPLTCLVILGRFDNVRFQGDQTPFVNILRVLGQLKGTHPLLTSSRLAIVLTHFMNGLKSDRQNPTRKIQEFASVVRTEMGLTLDPLILLAENQAEDRDLVKNEQGFYELPNGELFPYNIFKGIHTLIGDTDPGAESVFRSLYDNVHTYGRPDEKCIRLDQLVGLTSSRGSSLNTQRQQDQRSGNGTSQGVRAADRYHQETDVSIILENCGHFDQEDVNTVRRAFQRRRIQCVDDLPKNPRDIIQLAQDFPPNDELILFLRTSLGLQIPQLNFPPFVGQCFDDVKHAVLPVSIFEPQGGDRGDTPVSLTPMGFCVPKGRFKVDKNVEKIEFDLVEFHPSRVDNMDQRLTELNLESSSGRCYNIVPKAGTPIERVSAVREYRLFSLSLETDGLKLTHAFTDAFRDSPESSSRKDQSYGTHFITSCFGGGSLELTASVRGGHSSQTMRVESIQAAISFALLKLMDTRGMFSSMVNEEFEDFIQNYDVIVTLRGGNVQWDNQKFQPFSGSNTAALSGTDLKKWQEGLLECPIMLEIDLKLTPLTNFVSTIKPPEREGRVGLSLQNPITGSGQDRQAGRSKKRPAPPPPLQPQPPKPFLQELVSKHPPIKTSATTAIGTVEQSTATVKMNKPPIAPKPSISTPPRSSKLPGDDLKVQLERQPISDMDHKNDEGQVTAPPPPPPPPPTSHPSSNEPTGVPVGVSKLVKEEDRGSSHSGQGPPIPPGAPPDLLAQIRTGKPLRPVAKDDSKMSEADAACPIKIEGAGVHPHSPRQTGAPMDILLEIQKGVKLKQVKIEKRIPCASTHPGLEILKRRIAINGGDSDSDSADDEDVDENEWLD